MMLQFQLGEILVEGSVDPSIVVPEGEAGLLFMREYVRAHKNRVPARDIFIEGFVGFISYDLGEEWVSGVAAESKIPKTYFVYVREVRPVSIPEVAQKISDVSVEHLIDKKKYFEKLSAIQEYLAAGETYQVNFSVPFVMPFMGEASRLFMALNKRNQSSHQFFMETDDWALISNSPESLMSITANGKIITRPIKGTMPRGKDSAEDELFARELLADEKSRAELSMIVDLERNDMGRVCTAASVRVTREREIEKYSHVIHTVSTIEGQLRSECDWYDALKALFPGGSVTGCPKKRTMEIIRSLEGESRGVYCGSAGWIDLSGACDFSILIRTAWLDKKKAEITFRSGGAIIVDSDSEKEYEEILHKSAALASTVAACAE